MILFDQSSNIFHLVMQEASYIFGIGPSKHLIHYHFGQKIDGHITQEMFDMGPYLELGNSTTYQKNDKPLNLNITLLEIATYGKGDYREPTIHIETDDGYRSLDFLYAHHEILEHVHHQDLPQATKFQTLQVTLQEKTYDILLKLNYTVYPNENTIVRNIEVINKEKEPIVLDKMLSANFDFQSSDMMLVTLDAAWIRERHIHQRPIDYGIIKIDSKKGVSSSDHNPFIMLKHRDANKENGEVFGFNLIYSGNFEANIEKSPHDLLRLNIGINSFDFKWKLKTNERFITPEVVATFSKEGIIKLQKNIHTFVSTYLLKDHKPRPIMMNNWEATYFDFREKTIFQIAKKAKQLGIEGFVLDDGWFGERDDDQTSLGDWIEHPKKLKKGINHLSSRIKKRGLLFGLWIEPEMVSSKSHLFHIHPEWAIRHPKANPALGRNQLMLDYSNPSVIDYIYEALSHIFRKADVDYVKWDMNRNISDIYSHYLPKDEQGKLAHLYTLGLYQLLEKLKLRFPNVLFESCSSGGNRFDLGMHYYMPQAWTSDNTDAYERLNIQSGTAHGYPLSTISNHINDDIAHQTIRHIPLETRFNVAFFGVLGYELDPRGLTPFSKKVIQKQILFYKKYRDLAQYGTFYDLSKNAHDYRYLVVSKNKEKAIYGIFKGLSTPNPNIQTFRLKGLDPNKTYHITSRPQYENLHRFKGLIKHALPIKLNPNKTIFNMLANRYLMPVETFDITLTGKHLMHHGLPLPHPFAGTGYHPKMRMMMDFSSRLYILEEVSYGNH